MKRLSSAAKQSVCLSNPSWRKNAWPCEEDQEAGEKRTYKNVYEYLTCERYPLGATKADQGVLQRRAKSFQVVDGILISCIIFTLREYGHNYHAAALECANSC